MLKDEIWNLRLQGLTYNEIVGRLGCAKSTVAYYCGEDQSKKRQARQVQRKNKIRRVIQAAKSKPCMDCKVIYPYYVMDFDHRPEETKSFNISMALSTLTIPELMQEIAKCDVVCSNCHRVRTYQRLTSA